MQSVQSRPSIVLPPHTPRDVLKTLIGAHIQHQINENQELTPSERKQLEDDMTSEEELDKAVDELIETTDLDKSDVPIQYGFGVGAPPPARNE